jgi:dTDP-4-amino-4,6-dideoxygalactose transaminase
MRRELPPTAGLPLAAADIRKKCLVPFDEGLSAWLGIPLPILVCSGTAALIIALTTLKRRSPQRSRILLPAYTCPLAVLAAHFVPGTEIVPCDTAPNSINLSPEALDSQCDERTLAVVVTHLGGRVADVETAVCIARSRGAAVVEDAAQSMGARSGGQSLGLFSDAGFFSLAAGKGLTTFEGGVLFSRDPELHAELAEDAARILSCSGWKSFLWNARRIAELLLYGFFYRPQRLALIYGDRLRRELDRNDEIAAVGDFFTLDDIPLHKPDAFRLRLAANALRRLPDFLAEGVRQARRRIPVLLRAGAERVLDDFPGDSGVWPFLMVLMPDQAGRDAVLSRLWRQGLGVSKLFVHALPDYSYLAGRMSVSADCPSARDLAGRMFTITNSPWLDDETFARIVEEGLRP